MRTLTRIAVSSFLCRLEWFGRPCLRQGSLRRPFLLTTLPGANRRNDRHDESGDRVPHLAEFSQVLRQRHPVEKRLPLIDPPPIFQEGAGKRSRKPGRQRRLAAGECGLRGPAHSRHYERSVTAENPDVEEILHAAVGNAEVNHCLKFLGNHHLGRVSLEPGRFHFQHHRESGFFRHRIDRVAKTDVNLKRRLRPVQGGRYADAHAVVLGCLSDLLAADPRQIENNPVVCFDGADLTDRAGDGGDLSRAVSEEIDIASGTRQLPLPDEKQRRSLEHELVALFRSTEAVQKTFDHPAPQHELEIFLLLTRALKQLGAHRGGHVLGSLRFHATASKYGRMIRDTRQILAYHSTTSIAALFTITSSLSASIATPRRILLRCLNQSAPVLAGLNTPTGTPSI